MNSIQAIYEGGVFRPVSPVTLPEHSLVEFEPRVVESAGSTPNQDGERPTLTGLLKFAGVAKDLPADMAQQHDHYLHGTLKR